MLPGIGPRKPCLAGKERPIFTPETISWYEFATRLAAALVLPLLIGLERFWRRKPVDFRPFVIISLGACVLIIGVVESAQTLIDSQIRLDPGRAAEGIITGIGFLGAGAMFREGQFVQGAASAASIWLAGAIGVICGFGHLWLAGSVTLVALLLLVASGPFTTAYDPERSADVHPPADD